MSCKCCFSDYLAKCETEIEVFATLPELGVYDEYRWVITDKNGNKYEGELVQGPDSFVIPVSDLPDGFLTQYSGDFKLEVLDINSNPVAMQFKQQYLCADFSVKGGNLVKNNIGIS